MGEELLRRCEREPWSDFKIHLGQWLHFRDANGNGFAQPDAILYSPDLILILDAKLSHTPLARPQLEGLYKPLVQGLWPKVPVTCVEVCHNATTIPGANWINDLNEIFDSEHQFLIWHWLG